MHLNINKIWTYFIHWLQRKKHLKKLDKVLFLSEKNLSKEIFELLTNVFSKSPEELNSPISFIHNRILPFNLYKLAPLTFQCVCVCVYGCESECVCLFVCVCVLCVYVCVHSKAIKCISANGYVLLASFGNPIQQS